MTGASASSTTAGGAALYLGTGGLRRWNGAGFELISPHFGIYAMCVFDDGTGPALYAGGYSPDLGNIAKWTGSEWQPLGGGLGQAPGSGLYPYVYALAVHDDGGGGGPALFAAGAFGSAEGGTVPAYRVARWNGQYWDGLNGGLALHAAPAYDLAVFDDGSGDGPALYVVGDFDTRDDAPGDHIARWDGQSWSDVLGGLGGSGVDLSTGAEHAVAFGDSLFVGGDFTRAGDVSSGHIARLIGCHRCGPDCDGDGTLTLRDFVCFRNQFTGGDMQADFDGSGAIDLNDFVAFRNAYAAGCP